MSNELFGEVVKTISLDFAQKTSPVTVFAKQGDNRTRIIHIQPLMNGVPMNIDTSFQYVAKFAAKKPDGHYVYNDSAKINEDGTITVTLTDQTLAAHGNAICCIVLETQSGDVLSSQNFTLIVEFSAGAYQSLASSDEIMGLDDLIEQVKKLLDELSGCSAGLPAVTEEDNDKVPVVTDGVWTLEYVENIHARYNGMKITQFKHNLSMIEYGDIVREVELSWALNRAAKTLTLDGEALDVSLTTKTLTGLSIGYNSNKTWKLSATDNRGSTASATCAPDFSNGVYYGVAAEPAAYDSAFILGLTKELRKNNVSAFKADSGEDQYIYYAQPTRYGKCAFVTSPNVTGFALADTISFTNAFGYTEQYYVYKSEKANVGSVIVTVSAYTPPAYVPPSGNDITYYGAAEIPSTYNKAFLETLTRVQQTGKLKSFTVDAGENEYIFYASPVRLGTCQFSFGVLWGTFDLVDIITIESDLGGTEEYYIYKSPWDWYEVVTVQVQ